MNEKELAFVNISNENLKELIKQNKRLQRKTNEYISKAKKWDKLMNVLTAICGVLMTSVLAMIILFIGLMC